MSNNFFEQFMNAQRDMINSWADLVNPMNQLSQEEGEDVDNEEKQQVDFSYFNIFKLMEDPKEFFKNYSNALNEYMENPMKYMPSFPMNESFMAEMWENNPLKEQQELYWKNFMGLTQLYMQQGFNDPRELWKKYSESMSNLMSSYKLFQLFEGLKEGNVENMEEILDQWMKAYNNYLHSYFIPLMPTALQEPMKKTIDLYDSYYEANKDIAKPFVKQWAEILSDPNAFFQQGLGGYYKSMEELYGANKQLFNDYLDSPIIPLDEDMKNVQKKMLERMDKFGQGLINYYKSLGEIIDESTKDATDKFFKLMTEGVEPKTFEEFFDFWNKTREEFIESAFNSPEFKKIKEATKAVIKEYKEENEELLREYYSFLKIPKLHDVLELGNTVNEMQKTMEKMNNEIQEIRKHVEK